MVSASTYFSTSKDQKSTRKVVVHTNLAEKKQYKSTHTCAVFPDYFARKTYFSAQNQISIQISEKFQKVGLFGTIKLAILILALQFITINRA